MTSPSQSVDSNVHTDSILTEIDLELPNQQTAGDSPAVTTEIVQSLIECHHFYDDKAVRDYQDASISIEPSAQSEFDADGQTALIKAGDSRIGFIKEEIPRVHGVVTVQDQTSSCAPPELQAKSDASVTADGAQIQVSPLDLGISKTNQKRVSFKSQQEYLPGANGSIERDLLSDESATESESDDLVKSQAAHVVILNSLDPSVVQEPPKSNGNTDPLLENIHMDALKAIEKTNQTNSQPLSEIETLNVSESALDPLLDDSEPSNHFIPKKYVKECTDSEFDGELYSDDENNTTPRKKIKSVEPTEEELEIKLIDLEELDFCRFKSQYRLKSAWERIFDKYGHDFEGTSDEIDLNTGELVVDNGYIKNSEKSDLGTADEEFIDPEELKSLYSKEKDGFHVDYHDPYENDRDLQRKLKFNSMIPSKRKFQPTSDYESDCFQEFVDNNMKKQTRNMPYFCKYFNIPQEIYGHFGLDPNAFRCDLPVNSRVTGITRIRRLLPVMHSPVVYYSTPQPMMVRRISNLSYQSDYDLNSSKNSARIPLKVSNGGNRATYISSDSAEFSSQGEFSPAEKYKYRKDYCPSPLGIRLRNIRKVTLSYSDPIAPNFVEYESEDELLKSEISVGP